MHHADEQYHQTGAHFCYLLQSINTLQADYTITKI